MDGSKDGSVEALMNIYTCMDEWRTRCMYGWREMDEHADGRTDRWRERWICRSMGGSMDEWLRGYMDRYVDG